LWETHLGDDGVSDVHRNLEVALHVVLLGLVQSLREHLQLRVEELEEGAQLVLIWAGR
jgi:hypothetical protein